MNKKSCPWCKSKNNRLIPVSDTSIEVVCGDCGSHVAIVTNEKEDKKASILTESVQEDRDNTL